MPASILALIATSTAALVAYGTDPYWASREGGIRFILTCFRLRGVFEAASLLACIGVIVIVIAARKSPLWLIVLGPVFILFLHHYVADPARNYGVVEDPPLMPAKDASFLGDGDFVVGVATPDRGAFAYPYAQLFNVPVVLQSRYEKRFLLMWSPYANHATVRWVDHEIKLRDLRVAAMPANAVVVYDARLGRFINGLTGETVGGGKPIGFHGELPAQKMTWGQWRVLYPQSQVMALAAKADAPAAPVLPRFGIPSERRPITTRPASASQPTTVAAIGAAPPNLAPTMPVAILATTRPVAVPVERIDADPANITSGEDQLMVYRDPTTGQLRGFDRRVNEDLFPMLQRRSDPKHPEVVFVDRDSGSGWTADCKAVTGPLKGEHFRALAVEEGVYWGVMKYWYPDLTWAVPLKVAGPTPGFGVPPDPKPPRRRRSVPE